MIDIMENKVIGPAIRKGEAVALTRILTTKFGPPSDETVAKLSGASEPELLTWIDRALTARSLDEVFA